MTKCVCRVKQGEFGRWGGSSVWNHIRCLVNLKKSLGLNTWAKYLNEKDTVNAMCGRELISIWNLIGAIKSLMNARKLSIVCDSMHESVFFLLMNSSNIMLWNKKFKSMMIYSDGPLIFKNYSKKEK